jgi:hypothetical protein
VKLAIVWGIFIGCWAALRFAGLSPGWGDAVFVVAAIDAISIYFIRCEQCHEPCVSLRPDKVTSLWSIVAPAKTCPRCGTVRI